MAAPPVYDPAGYRTPRRAATTPLPAYYPRLRDRPMSAARNSTEHTFPLNDSKTKIRATLKLISNAPNAESLPVVLEGSNVAGSLSVNIPNGEKVSRVLILVRCA